MTVCENGHRNGRCPLARPHSWSLVCRRRTRSCRHLYSPSRKCMLRSIQLLIPRKGGVSPKMCRYGSVVEKHCRSVISKPGPVVVCYASSLEGHAAASAEMTYICGISPVVYETGCTGGKCDRLKSPKTDALDYDLAADGGSDWLDPSTFNSLLCSFSLLSFTTIPCVISRTREIIRDHVSSLVLH